jgi:hypothetical protein
MANGTMNREKLVAHIASKIEGASALSRDALQAAIVGKLLDTEEEATTQAASAVTAHLGDYCGPQGGRKLSTFIASTRIALGVDVPAPRVPRAPAAPRSTHAVTFKVAKPFYGLTTGQMLAIATTIAKSNKWLDAGRNLDMDRARGNAANSEWRMSACGKFALRKRNAAAWTLLRIDGGRCMFEKQIVVAGRYTRKIARGYRVECRGIAVARDYAKQSNEIGAALVALQGFIRSES